MATVIATTATTPTLAQVKVQFGLLADYLDGGAYPAQILSPGIIDILKAINASADTTDLRTT